MSAMRRIQTKLLETNTSARTVRMVLSTAAEDRHGDTVNPTGWKLDNYLANPVVLWGHQKCTPPIGKCLNIGVSQRGLEADIQFATADEFPLADTVYKLLMGGFLNAGSVGFLPIKYSFNDQNGVDFLEQELLEYSIVTVPSNPEALSLAKGIDLDPVRAAIAAAPASAFTELRRALAPPALPKPPAAAGRLKALAALKRAQINIATQA